MRTFSDANGSPFLAAVDYEFDTPHFCKAARGLRFLLHFPEPNNDASWTLNDCLAPT
jgi:hypothetical protein